MSTLTDAEVKRIKAQLADMRAKYTDAYIGIARCGCCLAMTIFDPKDKRSNRDAAKAAAEWLSDGLKVERVSAAESRNRIVAVCPHGSQDPGELDLFSQPTPAAERKGEPNV